MKLKTDFIKALKIRLCPMQGCPLFCLSSLVESRFKKVYMAPAIAITNLGKVKLKQRKLSSRSPTSQAKSGEVKVEENGNSLYELTIKAPSMRDSSLTHDLKLYIKQP